MKDLVIAEKPNMGKYIAKILGVPVEKGKSYAENEKYIVTWAYGHLITLKEPSEHDEKWGTWSLETLPIFPEPFQHKVIDTPIAKKQFKVIKTLIHRDDVGRIINAGDDGREGEYIQQLIYKQAKNNKPVVRVCIDSQTESKVKKAFDNLVTGKDYEKYNRMYQAGYCRESSYYTIGMTASRLIGVTYDTFGQSAGRVQTATLSMIRDRDYSIENFVPVPYWEVVIDTGEFKATYYKDGNTNIMERKDAEQIALSAKQGKTGKIVKIIKEQKKENRPQLYRLNTLQADGANIYGYSTDKVLELTQSLYDSHKIVTYPRTESSYINQDDGRLFPQLIRDIGEKLTDFKEVTEELSEIGLVVDKRVVDESKIEDHGAIIINENFAGYNLDRLSDDEKNILFLIMTRMCLAVSPQRIYNKTSLIFATKDGNYFYTTGIENVENGWRKYYNQFFNRENKESSDSAERLLNNLEEGKIYSIIDAEIKDKKTKPPKPFTDATLIVSMENISLLIEDAKLRKVMKARGLGTSATRSEIIKKLVERKYIMRTEKRKGASTIHITELGKKICDAVPQELVDVEWGAEWEEKLQKIEKGTYNPAQFMAELKEYIYSCVKNYRKKEILLGLSFPYY